MKFVTSGESGNAPRDLKLGKRFYGARRAAPRAVGSALCTCPRCLLVRGAEPPQRAERCEPVGVLQQSLCL